MTVANLGIAIDSSPAVRAVADLDKLVPAAARAEKATVDLGAAATSAARQTGTATADMTRRLMQAANDAESMATRINRAMQIGMRADPSARGKDIAEYGRQLDSLRAKFNPVYAELTRYRAIQGDIRQAHAVGAISTNEMATAIGRERAEALSNIAALKGRTAALREAAVAQKSFSAANGNQVGAFQTANIAAQFQDVAVTAAMGMSPAMIALQQGTQIAAVLGPMGATGAVQGLKTALMSVISPVSLVTIGLTGVAAAALGYFFQAGAGAKTLEDRLEKQRKAIDGLADGWKRVENSIAGAANEAQSILSFQSMRATEDLRKGLEEQFTRGNLTSRFASAGMFGGSNIFSEFKEVGLEEPIRRLLDQVEVGQVDIVKFNNELAAMGNAPGASSELKKRIDEIFEFTRALGDAQRAVQAFDRNIGPGGLLRGGSEFNRKDMDSYDQWRREEESRLRRSRDAAQINIDAIGARSPSQLADIARRREAGIFNDTEGGNERRLRIETAATQARTEAEYRLKEAQLERVRSLNESVDAQQNELGLIGQTAGAAAALRMEYDLTARLREEAARNGVEADQKELELIKQKTAEYGRLTDQIARANLNRDLAFEAEQMGRSTREAAIAQRLRGTGIGTDSPEADLMRRMQSVDDLRDSATGFFSAIKDGVLEGGDIGRNIMRKIGDAMLDEADKLLDNVIQTLVRALIPAPAAPGFAPGAGSAFAPTLNGFANMIFGGGANDNYAPGAVTRAPLSGATDAQSQVWNFFANKGLAPHQVAGVMGHVGQESAFNPSAIGDAGKAFGLFQHHAARGGGQGLLGKGLNGQLEHAWSELQSTEKGTLNRLMASTDVRSATAAFGGFERPSGYSAANPEGMHGWTNRLNGAQEALKKFGASVETSTASATGALDQLTTGSVDATQGVSQFGNTLANAFPAAPSAPGGGGLGGIFGRLFGGGGATMASMSAISPMAASHIAGGGFGLFDTGGYTGDGGRYEVAGKVHRGEVVWNQDDVAGAGGVTAVERMRRSRGKAGSAGGSMTYAPVSHITIGANAGVTKADVEAIVQNNNKDQAAAFEKKQANSWRWS